MTGEVVPSGRGRSALAVAVGFVLTILLSLGTDEVMHLSGVYPAWGEAMADGLYVWATLYRAGYTVLGAYVTARLAPGRPMAHAMVLGVIGLVAAGAGAAATWNAGPAFGPRWYPLLLVVIALPCVWAGGLLHARWQHTT
jgi:hypothetical protein